MKSCTMTGVAGRIAGLMALTFLPAAIPAGTDYSNVIPGDSLFAAWIEDATAMRKSAEASPLGQLWADPGFAGTKKWAEGMISEAFSDMSKDGEIDAKGLAEAAKGGVAVWGGRRASASTPYFMAVVESDEAGLKKLAELPTAAAENSSEAVTKSSFESAGVTVYRMEKTSLGGETRTLHHGTVGNQFFIAVDAEDGVVKSAVNALTGGGDASGSFAARSDVRGATSRWSKSDGRFSLFADIAGFTKMGFESNSMPADMIGKLEKTGLMDFQSLFASVDISAKGIDSSALISMTPEKRGLVRALYGNPDVTMDLARLAPSDSIGFSTWTLDVGALVDAIFEIAETFQPGSSGMAGFYTMSIKQQYGVDPLNEVLKNIAGEHSVYQRPLAPELKATLGELEAGSTSMALFLGLRNGQQTADNLKTLVTNLSQDPGFGSMLELSDVDGSTVVKVNMPGADQSGLAPSIAFNSSHLIIANNATELQAALRASSGKGGSSLADAPEFSGFARPFAKSGLRVFQYTSSEAIGYSMEAATAALSQIPGGGGFSPEDMPTAETLSKYFGKSAQFVYLEDGFIVSGNTMPAK